jgi:hypothetical protein
MLLRSPVKTSPESKIFTLSSSRKDDGGPTHSLAKILSIHRAKELFATREKSEFPLFIMKFLGPRLQSRLPSELKGAHTAVTVDDAQQYGKKWCEFAGIDGPELEFKYKRIDGSLYVTLSFPNEELPIATFHDGCLAWALRFLAQEREGLRFKHLMSVLLGRVGHPEYYPVFALHLRPGEYLSTPVGYLKPPKIRYDRINLKSATFEPITQKTFPKFMMVEIGVVDPESLMATHDWASSEWEGSPAIESLIMLVPESRCGGMWFDENGSLGIPKPNSTSVQYPICIPSKEIDDKWLVDQWDVGSESCLILFIRPSRLEEMARRLPDAVFVLLPLTESGVAHAFTREAIRQWAVFCNCPYIFCLDDNIKQITTIDKSFTTTLEKAEWVHVFKMLATHVRLKPEIGVMGIRSASSSKQENTWEIRHCQCLVVLNIEGLRRIGVKYEKKDPQKHGSVLGDMLGKMGPLEDYLLNFECEKNGLLVLQNPYYRYLKDERRTSKV